MQIEKNIAATLQRRMDEAGKTKLEFSRDLGIRLHRRACKETRHISGTADLRAGRRRSSQPGGKCGQLSGTAFAGAGACGGDRGGRAAALRRMGRTGRGGNRKRAGRRVSICALRGARRGKSAVCVWHFGPAAAGWGMENSRDDRAVFQRQRRDCASGAALHRAAA